MSHDVYWTPQAESELAEIVSGAADVEMIVRTAYRIDAILGNCAAQAGESRVRDERTVYDRPLTVYFRVDEGRLRVTVLRVHFVDFVDDQLL